MALRATVPVWKQWPHRMKVGICCLNEKSLPVDSQVSILFYRLTVVLTSEFVS